MNFSDLRDAFLFVGGAAPCEHAAVINRRTGEVCLRSEMGDLDEIPADVDDSDDWLEVPHRNDLGLGRQLVLAFVAEHLPDELGLVGAYFSRPGAYGNLKDLLAHRGLIDEWYEFENRSFDEAIRAWCEREGVPIED